MRRPRFSIAAILCATALVAFDLALVRSLFAGSRPLLVSVRFGLLMANVLPAAGYSLWAWRGRGRVRPFLLGFVAAGVTAALGGQAACLVAFPASDDYQARVALPVASSVHGLLRRVRPLTARYLDDRTLFYAATIPAVAAAVGAPQLLIALAGGLVGLLTARRLTERYGDLQIPSFDIPPPSNGRGGPPPRIPRSPWNALGFV